MKAWKIFWGLGFILLAIALILDAVGVIASFTSAVGEISFIAAVGVLLLFSFVIERLCRGKISEIFIPLAFIFMIIEKNIAFVCGLEDTDIINNGLLFGCAALLWIGFSIILSGVKKRNRKKYRLTYKHKRNESSLSSSVKYVDASDFKEEWFENNLGSLTIHFENADEYQGGGVLHVENNLGSTVINVPSSWTYTHNIDNSLGGVSASIDGGDPDGPQLIIKGENNLGSISIKYTED